MYHARRAGYLLLLLLVATVASAQTALFVNSAPIGAEVTINGTARGSTPLLLRELLPGEYEIVVIKRGFVPATERITLAQDEVRVVDVRPEPDTFVGAFSAERTIVDGEPLERQDAVLAMPSGVYELSADASALRLSPYYPNEGALRAARLVTIAGGVAAIISTVEDVFVRGEATSFFSSYLPSPGTIATWVVAIGAGGFWIALEAERTTYTARMNVEPYTGEITPADAERFYREAEVALEAGNLGRALQGYSRVIADGGDSEYVPDALYKSAQIYSISGDVRLAERLFELLLDEYPAPEVHDRALRSVAEIYREAGRTADAIQALERIVYLDDTYVRDEIDAEIEAIREGADR